MKRGETILILDRDTPVARIEPVGEQRAGDPGNVARLVKHGVVAPPRHKLDIKRFLAREPVRAAAGNSAVEALLEEREGGR